MNLKLTFPLLSLFVCLCAYNVRASKLVDVQVVDDRCLVIHWQDGTVEYNHDDLTSGSCNGWDYYHTERWALCPDKDQYIPYGEPLELSVVTDVQKFKITSSQDSRYGPEGITPKAVYRKSKVWEASHDERKPAMHHWIYLELPHAMRRGIQYTLAIPESSNSDIQQYNWQFEEKEILSPSIKISNIGYTPSANHKFADVYLWMGDGGARDFDRHTGNTFHLLDASTRDIAFSGELEFHMKNVPEPRYDHDFVGASVWHCDFSDFKTPGNYVLVIEGIGSSHPFPIKKDIYKEAFKVAMQGMFYQRMGCEEAPAGGYPKARRPLYKQGVEPEGFVVELSNRNMVTGTNPDNMKWYAEDASGILLDATWGGWSDAYDNDQRPVNFICVFDLLLTYYLQPTAFSDNQLYIPEWNNQIPDILDEALWEIDWWLRMRDPRDGGYLTGLCNMKPPMTKNYAGAACAWQGWCVAAGAAMVADCFRLNGQSSLQWKYTDAAIAAYNWASRQEDPMLDTTVYELRGRDLKMTAAAFLYNLTGNPEYEQVISDESVVEDAYSRVREIGKIGQQFATIAYIATPQTVNFPELQANMKASIINQAMSDYVAPMHKSPTKAARWTVNADGIRMTSSEMSLVAIAHQISEDAEERDALTEGLYSEAEWTLGRNPLGMVMMTGLGERSYTQTFAPGRRDGAPGLTPGWSPYMMRDGWKNADDIHRCEWYTNRNYPTDKEVWPLGEHFWNSRYCVPNSETTPQQTFRQKIVLYGYLQSL